MSNLFIYALSSREPFDTLGSAPALTSWHPHLLMTCAADVSVESFRFASSESLANVMKSCSGPLIQWRPAEGPAVSSCLRLSAAGTRSRVALTKGFRRFSNEYYIYTYILLYYTYLYRQRGRARLPRCGS